MTYYGLLITLSWLGTASLQYVNTGTHALDSGLDAADQELANPVPPYFHLPKSQFEMYPNDAANTEAQEFYRDDEQQPTGARRRRTAGDYEENKTDQWMPNLVDTDQTSYINQNVAGNPFVIQSLTGLVDENSTNLIDQIEKKSFSPWGGKRNKPFIEHSWTWKRNSNVREPTMPKRVRFSPWGGKRTGQMVYKPSIKRSKVIYAPLVPELTRIVSNYNLKGKGQGRLNIAGYQFIPVLDKRHPMKVLALSTQIEDGTRKEALPFKTFMEALPKMFKPGHLYADVNLKKDGKRKVKFSAWGGKRSPPIIGPIWTPAPQDLKESTLNTILLIRNSEENGQSHAPQ